MLAQSVAECYRRSQLKCVDRSLRQEFTFHEESQLNDDKGLGTLSASRPERIGDGQASAYRSDEYKVVVPPQLHLLNRPCQHPQAYGDQWQYGEYNEYRKQLRL